MKCLEGDNDKIPTVILEDNSNISIEISKTTRELTAKPKIENNNHHKMTALNLMFQKYLIIQKYLVPHCVVTLLTLLMIYMQVKIKNSCYRGIICECDDNTFLKLYSIFREIFLFWLFWGLAVYHSLFFDQDFNKHKFHIILVMTLCTKVIFTFYFFSDKNQKKEEIDFFYIEIICIFLNFSFYFYVKIRKKCCCVQIIKNFLKSFGLIIVLTLNGLFLQYIKNTIGAFLNSHLLVSLSINFYQIILTIYSNILIYFCKKTLFSHYKAVYSNDFNIKDSSIVMMRLCVIYIIAFNLSHILMMKIDEWGGWIFIINYILFVLNSYCHIEVKKILALKLLKKVFNCSLFNRIFKYLMKKKSEKKIHFEKIVSGCMLEMQFICFIRLISLDLTRKWIDFGFEIYYKNCELELSQDFIIFWSTFYTIMIINLIMIVIFIIYMKLTKLQLFCYVRLENTYYNLYLLFALHLTLENTIQMVRSASWL